MNQKLNKYETFEDKKIIKIHLVGGLGNILFQIATGYVLSKISNRELQLFNCEECNKDNKYGNGYIGGHKVDLPWNDNVYITDIFPNLKKFFNYTTNKSEKIKINDYEIKDTHSSSVKFINNDYYPKLKKYNKNDIPDKPNIILLNGYFFNPLNFDEHENDIKNLFKCDEKITQYINNKYKDLNESTAIHIRLNSKYDNYNSTTASNEWLNKQISKFNNSKNFYIFSADNSSLTKITKNLINKNYVVVNEGSIISFFMMKMCKNCIINPNSTYSWWASYLNDNPDKLIINPVKTFGISFMSPKNQNKYWRNE